MEQKISRLGKVTAISVVVGVVLLLTSCGGAAPVARQAPTSAPAAAAKAPAQAPRKTGNAAAKVRPAGRSGPRSRHDAKLPAHSKPRVAIPNGLYITDGSNSTNLLAINAATLKDLTATSGTPKGNANYITSADGSTTVRIDYGDLMLESYLPEDITIHVLVSRTGEERMSFHPPADITNPVLSTDGSRLVGEQRTTSDFDRPTVYVLDTSNGRAVRTIRESGPVAWYRATLVDPTAVRLYRLLARSSVENSTRPSTPDLIAYDLASGRKVRTIRLDGLRAGMWRLKGDMDGEDLVMAMWQPGFALSPDGSTIAIAHPERDVLTVIDARRMKVLRSVPLSRRQSLLERLGLAPGTAEAKSLEGTSLQAQFSPDGRRLYVIGQESYVDKEGETHFKGRGLRIIDAQRGEIIKEAFKSEQLSSMKLSPDGSALYTFSGIATEDYQCPCALRRLDPATLKTSVERRLDDYRDLYLFGKVTTR